MALEPFNQLSIKSAQPDKLPLDCNSSNLLDRGGSNATDHRYTGWKLNRASGAEGIR